MNRLGAIAAAILGVFIAQDAAAQVLKLDSYPPEVGSVFDYRASSAGPEVDDSAKGPLFKLPDLWKSDGLFRTSAFYYRLIGNGAVLAGAFVPGVAAPMFSSAVAPSDQSSRYGDILSEPGLFAVGVQQTGKKPDWLSGMIATAFVAIANSEVVVYPHKDHESHPSCFRLFTARSPHSTVIGVSFEW
jgi:hypothetical protein